MCLWLDWSFYAPRSKSTSNWMPWFNSKRWDIRESAYSHPSISKKCIAANSACSMCLAAVRSCIRCRSCQNCWPLVSACIVVTRQDTPRGKPPENSTSKKWASWEQHVINQLWTHACQSNTQVITCDAWQQTSNKKPRENGDWINCVLTLSPVCWETNKLCFQISKQRVWKDRSNKYLVKGQLCKHVLDGSVKPLVGVS